MGKFLKFIGGLFLLLIVLVVGAVGLALVATGPVGKEAAEYTDETLREVLPGFDKAKLIARATPESRTIFESENFATIEDFVSSNLGPFQALEEEVTCNSINVSTSVGASRVSRATCGARASFELNDAYVYLRIRKTEQWAVESIRFDLSNQSADDVPGATDTSLGEENSYN